MTSALIDWDVENGRVRGVTVAHSGIRQEFVERDAIRAALIILYEGADHDSARYDMLLSLQDLGLVMTEELREDQPNAEKFAEITLGLLR